MEDKDTDIDMTQPFISISKYMKININGTVYNKPNNKFHPYTLKYLIGSHRLLYWVKRMFYMACIDDILKSRFKDDLLDYREYMNIPEESKVWVNQINGVDLIPNRIFIDARDQYTVWDSKYERKAKHHNGRVCPSVSIQGRRYDLIRILAEVYVPRPEGVPIQWTTPRTINNDYYDLRIDNIEWKVRRNKIHITPNTTTEIPYDELIAGPYIHIGGYHSININGVLYSSHTDKYRIKTSRYYYGASTEAHVRKLFYDADLVSIKKSRHCLAILEYREYMNISEENKIWLNGFTSIGVPSNCVFIDKSTDQIWNTEKGTLYPTIMQENIISVYMYRCKLRLITIYAEAYVPKPTQCKFGHGWQAVAINGDPNDLRIENIGWEEVCITRNRYNTPNQPIRKRPLSDTVVHAICHDLTHRLDMCLADIAVKYNISRQRISHICTRQSYINISQNYELRPLSKKKNNQSR